MGNRVEMCQSILDTLSRRNVKNRLVIVDEKWVYHRGIASKHCNRGWVYPGGDRAELSRRNISDKTTLIMVAICFDGKGFIRALEDGQTVDRNVYCECF